MEIRAETPDDFAAIRQINVTAFGRPQEADLVDALRAAPIQLLSFVAVQDGQVVGHILFSPVSIESEGAVNLNVLGLAPMAVLPDYQRQGIGSRLVQHGLQECKRLGIDAVVVLGHPKFYPRFGFIPAKQKNLRCEYDVPDEVFMVAELQPEALQGCSGTVKFRPEFADV